MSIRAVTFTVLGVPVAQGSKTAIRQGARTLVVEDGRKRLKPWRDAVAAEAFVAMLGEAQLDGPLRLSVTFIMPRPKAHFGKGSRSHELKPGAPFHVQTKPDVDKLARAVADALEGIVYPFDSRIASLQASKVYGESPAAVIDVAQLGTGSA